MLRFLYKFEMNYIYFDLVYNILLFITYIKFLKIIILNID